MSVPNSKLLPLVLFCNFPIISVNYPQILLLVEPGGPMLIYNDQFDLQFLVIGLISSLLIYIFLRLLQDIISGVPYLFIKFLSLQIVCVDWSVTPNQVFSQKQLPYSLYRYQIPEDWPYQEARRLFKEPEVCIEEEQLELKWSPPDEEVIVIVATSCLGHIPLQI